MFAIIGAAGKVGYATAVALREASMPVRAILRDESKAGRLIEIGCEVAVANIQDATSLAKALADADVVQVILPPSPQDKDTAEQMRAAIESIAVALEVSRPKRILAISDYGAHITQDIGMPTMCRTFEQRLSQLDCDKLFLRSAEHMQGWGRTVAAVKASSTLPSFDASVAHSSPQSQHQTSPARKPLEIVHAEGPRRYSVNDVARTIGQVIGHNIDVAPVPRSHWRETLERVMSPSLAELIIKANDAQNEGGMVDVEPDGEVRYGTTPLTDALRPLFLI